MRSEKSITKEFLENLLDSMEGGVLAVDRNMRITAFNRGAEEISGLKREEVLNKECRQVLKGDLCQDECPVKKAMVTGEPVYSYEIMITNKAGRKIPVNVSTSALRSSSNEIIGAVENFRDLTRHKGLWAKLREERNRAHQYLNIAGVIIIAINEKGLITLINKKGVKSWVIKKRRSSGRTGLIYASRKKRGKREMTLSAR